MYSKSYADRVSGAVFLIGLGLLFTSLGNVVGGFFPGILFVIGASAMARGMAEGQRWYTVSGGLWMIGLGLVFLWGFSLPLLLIILGLTMLFGYSFKSDAFGRKSHSDDLFDDKRKNEDLV
ncbi:MAG: hypothetical protein U0703_30185 [Anaerolineae bacterium]